MAGQQPAAIHHYLLWTLAYYTINYTLNGGTISASYNVADAVYGTNNTQAGWTAGSGDTTFNGLSISGVPFNTTTFVPVSALQSLLTAAPPGFPATDFSGTARSFPGAPGALMGTP
jgi:hypothetical protein